MVNIREYYEDKKSGDMLPGKKVSPPPPFPPSLPLYSRPTATFSALTDFEAGGGVGHLPDPGTIRHSDYITTGY